MTETAYDNIKSTLTNEVEGLVRVTTDAVKVGLFEWPRAKVSYLHFLNDIQLYFI